MRLSWSLFFARVAALVVTASTVASIVLAEPAFAGAAAPTDVKDSAAGRAVFIVITVVVIIAAVILSLKYRKR